MKKKLQVIEKPYIVFSVFYIFISSLIDGILARFGIQTHEYFLYRSWYLLVFIYLIVKLFHIREWRKEDMAAVLFLAVSLIPNLIHFDTWNGDKVSSFTMIAFEILMCLEPGRMDPDHRYLQFLTDFCILSTFCLSAASLIGRPWLDTEASLGRYRGVYLGYNEAGAFALLSSGFSLYEIEKENKKKFNILNIFIQLAMLALCQSRTFLVSVFLMFAVVFYRKLSSRLSKKRIYIFAGFALLLLVSLLIVIVVRRLDGQTLQDLVNADPDHYEALNGKSNFYIMMSAMTSDRWILWDKALQAWKNSPLFGYGVMNAETVYHLFSTYDNTHSLAVNLLLFGGLYAFVSFIWYLSILLHKINWMRKDAYAILCIMICVILLASFNERLVLYDTKPLTFAFWIVIGYLVSEGKEHA